METKFLIKYKNQKNKLHYFTDLRKYNLDN